MSQQCWECGRQSPLGGSLLHYYGCEHLPTERPKNVFGTLKPLKEFSVSKQHVGKLPREDK